MIDIKPPPTSGAPQEIQSYLFELYEKLNYFVGRVDKLEKEVEALKST